MICWLDIETTGLDEKRGSILEIAMVLTTDELNVTNTFVRTVRPLPFFGVEVMDDYVKNMHTKSGLLDEVYEKMPEDAPRTQTIPQLMRRGDCEIAAVQWINTIVRQPEDTEADTKKRLRDIPLGGNSVHFDRTWIREHMPSLEKLFSHRNVDVSTITEMVKRRAPGVWLRRPGADPKTGKATDPAHRALDDIHHSILTARYYDKVLFGVAHREAENNAALSTAAGFHE